MTPLALRRHADTAWSVAGRIQGRSDIALLPGAACRLPQACRGMRVVTSPLARCVQTAALLGAPQAAREPRIIEMDWGEWQGESLAALRARLGDAFARNEQRGFDFRPQGGESPREVLQRVSAWLASLSEPTLAVTHRGVIRVVLAQATGWDMLGKPPVKLDWDAVHLFSIAPGGAPRVERLNLR